MTTATPNQENVEFDPVFDTYNAYDEVTDTVITRSPAAQPRSMAWRTWPDWVNVVIGVYLAFAVMWTAGAPMAWFLGLGAAVAIVGFVALAASHSLLPEAAQFIVGAVVVLSPWLGGFTGTAGAWTAWIAGVAVIVLAAAGLKMQRRAVR